MGLALFAYVAVPFGVASDAKAQNNTAADAAALAGAEAAQSDLVGMITSGAFVTHGAQLSAGAGLPAAQEYAAHNDAQVVEYYFDPVSGQAHVTVEGHPAEGQVSRSEAVAEIDLPDCDLGVLPTPPPVPSPSENPPGGGPPSGPPDEPPGPLDHDIDCGGMDLDAQVQYDENGLPQVTVDPDDLSDLVAGLDEPRLVD